MPNVCGIERARQQLDVSGREVLDMVVNDRDETGWAGMSDQSVADSITELLKQVTIADAVEVSRYIVESHRNGRCSCE